MTILLVQTFLLLLGAFLLGAALACIVRRAFAGGEVEHIPISAPIVTGAAASVPAVPLGETDRFGRALTGGYDIVVPQQAPTGPVVEVQPRPPVRVTPLIEQVEIAPPVAVETEPAPVVDFEPPPRPEPETVTPAYEREPAYQSEPEPGPEAGAVYEPQPEVVQEPLPEPAHEPVQRHYETSYTQIAVAAAAGAAALAAARGSAERSADESTEEQAYETESDHAADAPGTFDPSGKSYTEIAAAAAGGLAAAAAGAFAASDDDEEKVERSADAESTQLHDVPAEGIAPLPPGVLVGDDLTRIHSIDVVLREHLNRLGMTRFADIGGWSATDVMRFTQALGVEPGRIEQENWVGQAQVLASGGVTDYPRWRAPEDQPKVALPADGERLSRIIGIDPDSEALLRQNGVTSLAHIAAWDDDDVALFEDALGTPGRISRENWVEQARFLTRGSSVAEAIESIGAPVAGAAAAAVVAITASDDEPDSDEPQETDNVSEAEADAEVAAPLEDEPAEDTEPPFKPDVAGSVTRSEGNYSGFRSVRSEALIGAGTGYSVPAAGHIDDLKRIRGIGVLIEKKLHSLGIVSYEQVANWTGDDIERISQVLDFKGRIERENWIEQARILASGGQTEFSRRVDRGEA